MIGAGFGGLRVAKGLRGAPVDVTVVDPNNFHTFQPLLYQVASAGLDAGDVSFPVRGILRRSKRARFVLGAVTAVDLDRRTVMIDDEITRLRAGQTVISYLYPAFNKELVGQLAARGVNAVAMDQVPRTTRAQKVDALSSMGNLSGYRAVVEAVNVMQRQMRGQSTAAGKIPPCPGLAPWDSFSSIIFTCGDCAFSTKRASLKRPCSSRQPK